jgi:hypothetical protein
LPVVAQAVRPTATGTPVGAGSRRGLARDPCPGRRSSSAARRCGPLGVIRVLVGDMADEHLVMVHRPAQAGDRPDLALLERVLYGLHTI